MKDLGTRIAMASQSVAKNSSTLAWIAVDPVTFTATNVSSMAHADSNAGVVSLAWSPPVMTGTSRWPLTP